MEEKTPWKNCKNGKFREKLRFFFKVMKVWVNRVKKKLTSDQQTKHPSPVFCSDETILVGHNMQNASGHTRGIFEGRGTILKENLNYGEDPAGSSVSLILDWLYLFHVTIHGVITPELSAFPKREDFWS